MVAGSLVAVGGHDNAPGDQRDRVEFSGALVAGGKRFGDRLWMQRCSSCDLSKDDVAAAARGK